MDVAYGLEYERLFAHFDYYIDITMHHVRCPGCFSMGPGKRSIDREEGYKAALQAWNSR